MLFVNLGPLPSVGADSSASLTSTPTSIQTSVPEMGTPYLTPSSTFEQTLSDTSNEELGRTESLAMDLNTMPTGYLDPLSLSDIDNGISLTPLYTQETFMASTPVMLVATPVMQVATDSFVPSPAFSEMGKYVYEYFLNIS